MPDDFLYRWNRAALADGSRFRLLLLPPLWFTIGCLWLYTFATIMDDFSGEDSHAR